MGNTTSHRRKLVVFLLITYSADCLITPIIRLESRSFYNFPFNTPNRSSQCRYSISNNDDSESSPPSSGPSSASSPGIFFNMISSTSSTAKNKDIKSKVAPTIDSDLLRFLSQQKKVPIIRLDEEATIQTDEDRVTSEPAPVSENTNLKTIIMNGKTESIEKEETDVRSTSKETYLEQKPEWIDQFRSEKVTKTLIKYGSLREEARAAGIAVQNLSYLRMRRRSVNRFLKDRDELWATYKLISGTSLSAQKGRTISNQFSGGYDLTTNATDVTSKVGPLINDNVEEVISVLIESGLTATDCAAILSHTPSVALMRPNREEVDKSRGVTLEETLKRSYGGLLFNTLRLRKYDARKVLRTCPGLLTKRGAIGGEKMIELLTSLGTSTKSLARDKRFLPELLSRSPSSVFRLVTFLASSVVRLPIKNVGPLIRNPNCLELLNAVCHVPTPSETFESTALDILPQPPQGIIIRKEAEETYKNMKETADALRHELGIQNVGKMVVSYPGVLLLDPATQIYPVADFLYNEIGLSEVGVPQVLETFPSILKADVQQMRDVFRYLIELEVSEHDIPKIFRSFPSLLTLDIEKDMSPVVLFLREIGVVNIGRFITRLPAVLGYSVEDELKPKWGYLTQVCGFDYFEVVRFPAYFSYPLERITSRYEYLGSKRIPLRLASVDAVLRFGDNMFATEIAGDKDNGASFRDYIKERRSRTKKSKQSKKGNDRSIKQKRNGSA